MSRLPIRLRVTLAFAAAMAVVLLAVGLLIHVRYGDELNASIDRGLRSRVGDVASLLRESDDGSIRLPEQSESLGEDNFSQILTRSGRVLDTTGRPTSQAVLDRSQLRAAAEGLTFTQRDEVPGLDSSARLLATTTGVNGRPLIVVVGTPLDDRDEALQSLTALLWLGGAAALLLASLAGYAAVTASLRPVEAIRRQASAISAADPQERLPVPAADDELRRLGETLNAMLARLEAALERERAFVDDASHELRTPLAMQRAELELALRQSRSVDELRASIASAIEETDRLSRLAEDLLVLARSEKGSLPVKLEQVDVGALLTVVAGRFRSRALASERELDVEPGDGVLIHADGRRLEQALGNLVDNSVRHGGGPIRLWSRRNGSSVELHVTDTGEGFGDFAPHAFERFSRADSVRTEPGTGLGLAIVEAIAEAHHGSAAVADRPQGGADAWLELPIRA